MCLKSVGLGLDCVPFHAGWELVVWKPCLSMSEWIDFEFERICDEIEAEDSIEVVGPQIELDLGQESLINDVEPPVEVPGVVPTVVVEEEVLASVKKKEKDQAEGIRAEPIPEADELKREDQSVGTGEPVYEHDRSGEEPDLMDVDPTVRTGEAPVREGLEERTGVEPVPKEAVEEIGLCLFRK